METVAAPQFEITRPHHTEKRGIYAISRRVKPRQYVQEALDMAKWLDEHNGSFTGSFSRAYAISHCQVHLDDPIAMFVVAKELCEIPKKGEKQGWHNFFFVSRAIFNPVILDASKTLKRVVPVRKLNEAGTEMVVVPEEKEIDNIIHVKEGCMSFPNRSERGMDRFFRIKVRYQYLQKLPLVGYVTRTKTEWIEGLKAHMFQHEVEHHEGKNMHFK